MPKQKKTNAARILDEKKIEYTLIEYAVDEEHLDAVRCPGSWAAAGTGF